MTIPMEVRILHPRPAYLLPLLVIAQFVGTSVWFATNAVLPSLQTYHPQAGTFLPTLTTAVQLGFVLGTLCYSWFSAAFQIEGAASAHGRGPSIWDTFAKRPGKIKNNDHAEGVCDHYYRYEEDLERTLGVGEYRFSQSWSSILPAGTVIKIRKV